MFTKIHYINEKKLFPKFRKNNLIRTADLKKMFSKSDTTDWSYKLHKITEIIVDTKPIYCFDNSPERYIEAFLTKTTITLKENDSVTKNLKIT